jgi:hypothetical protein
MDLMIILFINSNLSENRSLVYFNLFFLKFYMGPQFHYFSLELLELASIHLFTLVFSSRISHGFATFCFETTMVTFPAAIIYF